MNTGPRTAKSFLHTWFVSVLLLCCLWFPFTAASAQVQPTEERAANFAEGRVIICVAKDGIIMATLPSNTDPKAISPAVVPIAALRAGVLLGAVEWAHPGTVGEPVRLDAKLRQMTAPALARNAALTNDPIAASDLEAIGVSVLEHLRPLAEEFHGKINLAKNEPLVRLVLASYVPDYGPDVWTLDYPVRQEPLGNGYYQTRILRPSYTQLYPPEKGRPHTLIEVDYPPEPRFRKGPELLDLLRANDPRLTPLRSANEKVGKAVRQIVDGESQKSDVATDAEFLRAAIPAVAGPGTKMSMVNVDFQNGYQWVVAPPPGERPQEAPQEPGAPTLRRKPGE